MIRNGEAPEVLLEAGRRIYSNGASYILRRDLSKPLARPQSKISFKVRPVAVTDFPQIAAERPRRLPALRANIPTCYVAETEDGSICYMQWLVKSEHQGLVKPHFKGELANLSNDSVLLEFAYTFEKFRGAGVMGAAMAEIAERAIPLGAKWAFTYVKADNVPSLKGCAHAGFKEYMIRTENWRGLHLRQSFKLLNR
jgi:GNAT superfamily N-acetyltransferase